MQALQRAPGSLLRRAATASAPNLPRPPIARALAAAAPSSPAVVAASDEPSDGSDRGTRRTARAVQKGVQKGARAKQTHDHPRFAARSRYKAEYLRKRPARPLHRGAAPKLMTFADALTLPTVGLSCAQLAALAGRGGAGSAGARAVVRAAREIDADGVHDEASVMSAELVELVVESMRLDIRFKPQTLSLLPTEPPRDDAPRRPPVITVMGHVDHGKTSLLDALRKSDVAKHEHGGITQSVAAFRVPLTAVAAAADGDAADGGAAPFATFIDTPGHAAFSAMRANGTLATDLVVLVVAADDGVMPQTVEAAELARAANVPLIVAVNKVDAPAADADNVRYQLVRELDLSAEQLGGDVQCVDISAKTGAGLDALREAIALEADMLDLRCDPDTAGAGVCLESRVDRSLGGVATVVLRAGTLRRGDFLVFQSDHAMSGELYGRVRLLLGPDGKQHKAAAPGDAVGVVGLRDGIPPGAQVCVVKDEKTARAKSAQIIASNSRAIGTVHTADNLLQQYADREEKQRAEAAALAELAGGPERRAPDARASAADTDEATDAEEDAGPRRKLLVVIKGDVRGSADAVAQCLRRLGTAQVGVKVLSIGVGEVNESDLRMAAAAVSQKGSVDRSIVVGFNLRVKDVVRRNARRERVELLAHNIIYHLEDEVKERVEQLRRLDEKVEKVVGEASVLRVFEDGAIAGCKVDDGAVAVGDTVKVKRLSTDPDGPRVREEVFCGEVTSIKHFAKSVRSMAKGNECGISVKDWREFRAGDVIVNVTYVPHT